jgi:two-component system, NtrC family, response regulator HupR/HoxA
MDRLPTLLVVDDEVRSQEALRRTLEEAFDVHTASSAEEAERIMAREWIQIVLCDHRMPGTSGVEFLKSVRERWPDAVRIIVSGYTNSEDIIAGINEAGIYQYVLKPWQPDHLLLTLRNAAELHRLQHDLERLSLDLRSTVPAVRRRVEERRAAARGRYAVESVVRAPDSPMNEVCALVEKVAAFDIPILVTGESGTGKELLARAIHYGSPRADRAFVVENCGALPDELLESELFGYKRGAFTGAFDDRVGLFQQADGGTIFLDEIGETSPAFQIKLLRVLQEGEVRPLGGAKALTVDVRVIAATNRDLERDVAQGRFREDLYYRLAAITVEVPPLRARRMDIPLIARRVLDTVSGALSREVEGFDDEVLERLRAYRWPGNVRELRNEILRMLALSDGRVLSAADLSARVLCAGTEGVDAGGDASVSDAGATGTLKDRLEALEAKVLSETMRRHGGNKSRAASELGLSRVGLRSKLVRHGLD